jgi:hypothetical protein
MLDNEFTHASLDLDMQRLPLTRRTRMRRKRIHEMSQTIQHEHRTVPSRVRSRSRGALLLCCMHAHPHCRVDECVKRTLDSRAFAVAVGIGGNGIVGFGGVQRENRAEVLGVC